MDLKEFVQTTIEQVIQGVKASFPSAQDSDAWVAGDPMTKIEFDVAVTTCDVDKAEGKAGLQVWGIGLGGKSGNETTNSQVSRVKLSVSIRLPQDPKKCKEADETIARINRQQRERMS